MTIIETIGTVVAIGAPVLAVLGYLWQRNQEATDKQIETLFDKSDENEKEHRTFSETLIRIEEHMKFIRSDVTEIKTKMNGDRP